MAKKRIYCRNFVRSGRGPCSAVLVQEEDGGYGVGTIFFLECGGEHVTQPAHAQKFCEDNIDLIIAGLHDMEDDGIIAGWSGRPWTEQAMIEKALEESGWRDS